MHHLYSLFGFMCNHGLTQTTSTGVLKSGVKAYYPQWLLNTMQLWDLHLLRNRLDSGSILIIRKDIAAWFNVVTLAYFVMSAGSQHRNGLVLSLGKYTSSEQDTPCCY